MNKVRIAITGHTNVGKTTLVRTLTKNKYGVARDQANVNHDFIVVDHDSLYATFVDCPGFTQATSFLKYEQLNRQHPDIINMVYSQEDISKMQFDKAALEGTKGSDIALYVISLDDEVPQSHHNDEIDIIRLGQKNIIAIFNKSRLLQNTADTLQNTKLKDRPKGRLELWEEFVRKENIKFSLQFDAFWDTPAKIEKLYGYVKEILSSTNNQEKLHLFEQNLNTFKGDQENLLKELTKELANCILECRKYKKQYTKSESESEKEINQSITEDIEEKISTFFEKSTKKYKFEAGIPIDPVSKQVFEHRSYTKKSDVATTGSAFAGFGAAIGGGIGAIFGGAVAYFSAGTGIPAIPAGIQAGASIGAALIGGGGGVIGVVVAWDNNIETSLSKDNLTFIASLCLGILCELYYHGYGNLEESQKMPKLEKYEIEGLMKKIEEYSINKEINLSNATEQEISDWCVGFFEYLANLKFF